MQTHFDLNALARPEISTADEILRKCVHCGFCTATCPTYVLTGDERDSPRGRIWMMRDLLGGGDKQTDICLLYTSPSPRDRTRSRMPSSA